MANERPRGAYIGDFDTYLPVGNKIDRDGGGREGFHARTVTGSIVVDLEDGNVQELTLTGNVTLDIAQTTGGYACSATIYLVQDDAGGRLITWNDKIKWPGATPPTLTSAAGARDLITIETLDGGNTWFACPGPTDFR